MLNRVCVVVLVLTELVMGEVLLFYGMVVVDIRKFPRMHLNDLLTTAWLT